MDEESTGKSKEMDRAAFKVVLRQVFDRSGALRGEFFACFEEGHSSSSEDKVLLRRSIDLVVKTEDVPFHEVWAALEGGVDKRGYVANTIPSMVLLAYTRTRLKAAVEKRREELRNSGYPYSMFQNEGEYQDFLGE